jgi:hypothetical protein
MEAPVNNYTYIELPNGTYQIGHFECRKFKVFGTFDNLEIVNEWLKVLNV